MIYTSTLRFTRMSLLFFWIAFLSIQYSAAQAPTVQASEIDFNNTTTTSTTISWTNGDGASRAVFIRSGVSGIPVPVNNTTYSANAVFGLGTQIGSTGWYCIYNGTGTSVDLTGLTEATTYQVMALEYNGVAPGDEIYHFSVSTGNPSQIATNTTSGSTVGPGGAITGLQLWLDASNGMTASGGNLTAWTDQAAINTFAVSATPPTVISNAINFHSSVNFANATSANTYPATQNLIGTTSITYVDAYAVFKVNNSIGGTIVGATVGGSSYGRAVFSETGGLMYTGNGTQSAFSNFPYTDYLNFHVFGYDISNGNPVNGRVDAINKNASTQISFKSASFIPTIGTTNNNGNSNGWPHLKGQIAEVIIYNQTTAAQRINIESYLALKYGIHKIDNYVDSASNIVWDATANAAYHNDVFGIGIDDVAGLNQIISNSMNTGGGDGTGQTGKGNIIISNPSSLVNNDFLIIGHDLGLLTEALVTVGGSATLRVQRTWKVQSTGNTGTVSLSYDVTGLSYSAQIVSDYVLLVDPTGTGNFTGGGVVKYPAAALGAKIVFNTVALPTGAVFTFQTSSVPTIQATNVIFSNTTGTATKVNWTNGNGSSRIVFMYAGASGSASPVDLTAYSANSVFGSGTQIGATGWYCVYNGIGTTVNVTGLTPATTYQVMTVEYSGILGTQLYLSAISTGNPAGVTTLNNVATLSNLTISQGTLTPVFATGTTNYTATVNNTITNLTVTPTTTDANATVTVNGTAVASGNPTGAIALAVGSNVITTVVTAQDGTTIDTYTITITRTEPVIVTTGTLSALTTIYGTPSASGTFNVSGTDMLEGILVTAPSGFEVSIDNITFTDAITVGAAGIIVSTPVYIRLKGTIPAGSYLGDIVLSSAAAATVNFATVSSTVSKAPLTITANNETKIYGSANPSLTASYTGFVNGDTETSLTTSITISTTAVLASPVGIYPITASGGTSDNYTFNYVDGSLNITPANLAVTADNQTKTYGSANPTLTVAYSGFVNGETEAVLLTPPIVSTTADTSSPVGVYPITVSGATAANYTIGYTTGATLTITPANLTVTADAQTKTYGSANPILTASYTGFVNGDTAASLTTPATISTIADATSPVGTYPITSSGAVNPNYTISYVDGTLTVTAATLTITADAQSKTYGSTNPTLTASYSGFVNGDTESSLTTPPTISTIADATSPVGTYPITSSGAVNPNYTISYVDGTLTVTAATLTITADAQSKTYGSTNPTLTASYTGFLNGDTAASLTTPPTIATTSDVPSPVGTYPITASGAVNPNYTIAYIDGILTVTAATLTITADAQTKTYGSANPTLTASYTGFVNGDTAASLTTPATISTIADATSPVGTYPITASGAVNSNYTIAYVDGTLTVTAATLTITADAQSKTYGSTNPTLTATYTGFVNGDTAVSLTTPATIATIADVTSPVGTYPITASGAVSANYTIAYTDGTLTVNPATLTVSADAQIKIYGDANPTLTASYTGFVNGDTAVSLTTPPTISTIADVTSPVGTYPITASGAVNSNYTIAYVDGILTVTAATLTITADAQTKIYGSANPTLTASYTGFVNGDTVATLTTPPTISTIADATSSVGTYPITASGAVNPNYTIAYIDGTLTVTAATLTITADDKNKVYGDPNPTLTVSYTGFANGDSETSLLDPPTINTTATTVSSVGTYPIVASGASDPNYTINYIDGTLTISATTLLTIVANNQSKIYGEANPVLTISYIGFVNGDTEASLNTLPTISTTAIQSSPVGTYPITASGAVSANYTIAYTDGILTVNPATLTVTADAQSKTYGSANPTLTATYSGFVNGDTATSLTTPPTITTTADATSSVGTYPITTSGAVNPNYAIAYVDGILTVTAATLTITADAQTKAYGSVNPNLTASYTGFVNGDTAATLTTAATITTIADATSPVGTYPITANGAVNPNYTIAYVDGTLTVTAATLTITADNKNKVYGDPNPTLTVSYTGFANGDTEASLLTPPTINTTATTVSSVGTYPIVASGASDPNYTINYIDGTLTISATTLLTIVANNQSKIYGEANPVLTISYIGFVNGDTEASLNTLPTISTTAIQSSPVGTYPITASGAVSANYTIAYTDGILTVNPATLTVTADAQTKIYGDANPTLTASYSGLVNGDTAASLTTPATISTIADATSPVGTYPITASGAVNPNYTIAYVDGTLTVTVATLTITADAQTKAYGSVNPALTASYTGFVNGDTAATLTTAATITTTADATSPVGTYLITASGAVNPNYAIAYVDGTLTVTAATLTITADAQTKTYGDSNPTLTASYTGFVNGDTATSLTTPPTITTTADATSSVGTYPITANGAVNPNYAIAYVDGTLTVTAATLTITADAQTKIYGDSNPTLTASYSGFVNGDTATSLTTPPTIATTAVLGSPVGTYPITANGAVNPNYTIAYVDGILTVTAATLTITADAQTKTYGSVNPTLTASYTGFVNGDTAASLTSPPTIATTAVLGSPVGTYPITAIGAVNPNYTIAYVDGTLTVNAATLTITADNKNKVYGDANPTLTVSYTGFANGDTEASLLTPPTINTTATTVSSVGTYPIVASGASDPNYAINYIDGTLTISATTLLTIVANNQSKIYGEANPVLTISYIGFVNGDTEASLTTLPTISTTAIQSSPVGTYPITASGAVSTNYTIAYTDGILTVNPATLTVRADAQTKIYGDSNPTLTASYTGFVNGDTATSLTTPPTIATTAVLGSPVGTYPITASGAVNSNYTIAYVDGILTVTTATLTITADAQSKTYGSANPTLTASYTGFVNGDTAASLTTPPIITTIADATSTVGTYPITASGAVSANYTIAYTDGILTVNPATLTVTADAQTKIYGDANPTLTASYTGFVNGDTAASLTTPATISTIADATSPVGTYPIMASGAVNPNYTIAYVDGTLTVTAATLTITADAQTKTYGDANPTLTASYSGFVNGDTATSLTTPPTITTIADATSPVGTYTITASGAVNSNYTIGYVDGILTVTAAILTVTADDQSKDFGEAIPTLTASYTGFVNGDTVANLTTLATVTTTANAASLVGTYPITASGALALNYTFNYVDGILTVTPLTDATLSDLTISEGTLTPAFATGTTNYTANVANDITSITVTPFTNDADAAVTINGITVISGNASGVIALAVGSNVITTVVTAQDGITTETYTVVVNRTAPPTIVVTGTLAALTTTYGTVSTSDIFNVSGTDMLAGILVTAPSGFEVSSDGIIFSNSLTVGGTGTIVSTPVYIRLNGTIAAGNYSGDVVLTSTSATTVTLPIANSTVNPAALTITANDATRLYGAADPAFSSSATGFVNGDTNTIIATPATITSTATVASPIGNYELIPSGAVLTSSNYIITYVSGNLAINAATLTITANNQTKTYGSANPALTASYTGFVNGDTVASLTTAPTISTTAVLASAVGTYPITVSAAASSNYAITYVNGNLTVTTVPLTITADDKSRVYGAANPTLTASYTGFVNGDNAASLTTPPVLATIANATSPVGVYAITVNNAGDPNYTITYITGTLTVLSPTDVNLASLTISNGVLTPAFSPNVLLYNTNVSSNVNSETITLAADDPLAKITINGVAIISGGSYTINSLQPGVNAFVIKVTSEDGLTTKSYILNITKEGDDNASLSNLKISNGILDPKFNTDITNYNTVVKYDVASITVTPTVTDPGAKITVNGLPVTSNTASTPIILNFGDNTIETVVTAEDGVTKETYTIIVYKGLSPDALVINNILSPNGDGKNDFWVIKDIDQFPNNKVTVYDRAGRIVYTKNSYSNEWDGTYSGSPLNNDTYYYLIDLGDGIPRVKGFITMIRD